jgi:hypothetical protein
MHWLPQSLQLPIPTWVQVLIKCELNPKNHNPRPTNHTLEQNSNRVLAKQSVHPLDQIPCNWASMASSMVSFCLLCAKKWSYLGSDGIIGSVCALLSFSIVSRHKPSIPIFLGRGITLAQKWRQIFCAMDFSVPLFNFLTPPPQNNNNIF